MAGEKAQRLRKEADDAITATMRDLQETHGLRHLYGQRLDLSDGSPDWYLKKLLKREGLAPPLVEQGKDVDAAQHAAEAIVERLRRRRAWLVQPEARCTPEMAQTFNQARQEGLAEYREALTNLNRAIRDFNLAAPSPLHRRGVIVADAVARAEQEVVPLPETSHEANDETRTRRNTLWPRLRKRS
jgi:hypothetical protein